MALIKKITKEIRNAKLHNEVFATYNVVIEKGTTYIQINTFGSENREIKGKVSQSIQMDLKVLEAIMSEIKK